MAKYPPLSLNSKLPFGKYRGRIVRDIIKEDTQYIEWLVNNTSVEINFDEVEQEDELHKYILDHYNPYNLAYSELRLAILSSLNVVKKQGNPTVGDWDDEVYQKPEYKSVRYGAVY